jgi:putative addiction module CopG family antidote
MTIRLKPELESLVEADVARGSYRSVDEFVERAVELLHEQEEWLAANREEIRLKVEEGYQQASRGELHDPDEAIRRRNALREGLGK